MEKFSDKVKRYLKEVKVEATPDEWVISYKGKKSNPGDLPPQLKKIYDQMIINIKKDKQLYNQLRKKDDRKHPDMHIKSTTVDLYDENGKVVKSYKI